jgi:hypothetical protein
METRSQRMIIHSYEVAEALGGAAVDQRTKTYQLKDNLTVE